ncbi:MAG: histidine--tRNA ligase [Candidatus Paceibacterota bacterium]
MASRLQTPRGMKDILPEDYLWWQWFFEKSRKVLEYYGFSRIETPILEKADLFLKGHGKNSELVQKEMYTLKTKKESELLVLRPEGTAPVARAYLQHGLFNLPQPVKLYYFGPFFRHEKPQKGRYRQFYQLGYEIIGEKKPILDAEIILVGKAILTEIGFKNKEIQIILNSIGCAKCRKKYLQVLKKFYRPLLKKVCSECRIRYQRNPLRMLDCKSSKCQGIKEKVPSFLDYLCDECSSHFREVLKHLDNLGIDYYLDKTLVRGLDYYTNTVIEFTLESHKKELAIGGGGRYDNLIKTLGRIDKPALGIAFGVERIIEILKSRKLKIENEKPEIFLIQIGLQAKEEALKLLEKFRKENISVLANLAKDNLKDQLKLADKLGVNFCLILGQQEINDGMIILKDMVSGIQENLPLERIEEEIKKRLKAKVIIKKENDQI